MAPRVVRFVPRAVRVDCMLVTPAEMVLSEAVAPARPCTAEFRPLKPVVRTVSWEFIAVNAVATSVVLAVWTVNSASPWPWPEDIVARGPLVHAWTKYPPGADGAAKLIV